MTWGGKIVLIKMTWVGKIQKKGFMKIIWKVPEAHLQSSSLTNITMNDAIKWWYIAIIDTRPLTPLGQSRLCS